MKLSKLRGTRRARTICLLAQPLARLARAQPSAFPLDGAGWMKLVMQRQREAMAALAQLTGLPLPLLGMLRDGWLRPLARRTLDEELLALAELVRQVGSAAVLAAVCRHGAPPTLPSLAALLAQDDGWRSWRHYAAEMGRLTAQGVYGGKLPRCAPPLRDVPDAAALDGDALQTLAAALRRKGADHHQAV